MKLIGRLLLGCMLGIGVSTMAHAAQTDPGESASSPVQKTYTQVFPRHRSTMLTVLGDQAFFLSGHDGAIYLNSINHDLSVEVARPKPGMEIVSSSLKAGGDTLIVGWSEQAAKPTKEQVIAERERQLAEEKKRRPKTEEEKAQEKEQEKAKKKAPKIVNAYVRVSHDGGSTFQQPKQINKADIGLIESVVGVDEAGTTFGIAMLEKDAEGKAHIRLLSNSAEQWQEQVIAEAAESEFWSAPVFVSHAGQHWLGWKVRSATQKETRFRFYTSTDAMQTWRELPSIALHPQAVGTALLRTSHSLYFSRVQPGLGLAISVLVDGPATWQEISMPTLEQGLQIAGYSVVAAADDVLHFLLGLKPTAGKHTRQAILYTRMDTDHRFAPLTRLNTSVPEFGVTASAGSLALGPKGQDILVVWQDLRLFRTAIFANYSADGGKTWQASDFPLSENLGKVWANSPVVRHVKANRFVAGWNEFEDGKEEEGIGVVAMIDPTAKHETLPIPSQGRLLERVNAYWRHREGDELEQTFLMYDPFYRVRTDVKQHVEVRRRVKIIIHAHTIDGIVAENPRRAFVKVRYDHEVPEFELPNGKLVKVDRQWSETQQEWVWIDDDWFLVHKDLMGKGSVRY